MNSQFKKLYKMNEHGYATQRNLLRLKLDSYEKLDIAEDYTLQMQRLVLLIENALRVSKISDVYKLTDKLYNELEDDYNEILLKQSDYLNAMEHYEASKRMEDCINEVQ